MNARVVQVDGGPGDGGRRVPRSVEREHIGADPRASDDRGPEGNVWVEHDRHLTAQRKPPTG